MVGYRTCVRGKSHQCLESTLGFPGRHLGLGPPKVWEGLDADTLCDRAVVIAGNPDDCIEALKKHEASGVDQMMVMMQTETIPHEQVMESIRLWGEYIIPEFKKSSKEVSVS